MKRALNDQGSTADFIAMVAFKDTNTDPYERDMDLLRSHGIIVLYLKRLLDSSTPLLFAEMALLKVTPWSFVEYERIQFLDGDVMPTKNMDCYFQLGHNSFTIGAVSPLNSGWFLAKPNVEDYNYLIQKVGVFN
jgi:alpha-N-acetylglucosamine transferase